MDGKTGTIPAPVCSGCLLRCISGMCIRCISPIVRYARRAHRDYASFIERGRSISRSNGLCFPPIGRAQCTSASPGESASFSSNCHTLNARKYLIFRIFSSPFSHRKSNISELAQCTKKSDVGISSFSTLSLSLSSKKARIIRNAKRKGAYLLLLTDRRREKNGNKEKRQIGARRLKSLVCIR